MRTIAHPGKGGAGRGVRGRGGGSCRGRGGVAGLRRCRGGVVPGRGGVAPGSRRGRAGVAPAWIGRFGACLTVSSAPDTSCARTCCVPGLVSARDTLCRRTSVLRRPDRIGWTMGAATTRGCAKDVSDSDGTRARGTGCRKPVDGLGQSVAGRWLSRVQARRLSRVQARRLSRVQARRLPRVEARRLRRHGAAATRAGGIDPQMLTPCSFTAHQGASQILWAVSSPKTMTLVPGCTGGVHLARQGAREGRGPTASD